MFLSYWLVSGSTHCQGVRRCHHFPRSLSQKWLVASNHSTLPLSLGTHFPPASCDTVGVCWGYTTKMTWVLPVLITSNSHWRWEIIPSIKWDSWSRHLVTFPTDPGDHSGAQMSVHCRETTWSPLFTGYFQAFFQACISGRFSIQPHKIIIHY